MNRIFIAVMLAALAGSPALAHCDTVTGPVVVEAREALLKGDVTPLLKWVDAEDEEQVRNAFARTLSMKDQEPEVRRMAEDYFLETLVRVHRKSEGEAYTGLKTSAVPAEITLGDRAASAGDPSKLLVELEKRMRSELGKKLDAVVEAAKHKEHGVEAGRRYVEAYVDYIHYVDRLFTDIGGGGGGCQAHNKSEPGPEVPKVKCSH